MAPARKPKSGEAWKLPASAVVLALLCLLGYWTWAGFSGATSNAGNSFAAGTVTITDDDVGAAMVSINPVRTGQVVEKCITVTYTGSLPAIVKMYGTTTGSGLDSYLDLTVTRGTSTGATFPDCSGFIADATNFIGQGAGVVFNGTLQAYLDSFNSAALEPAATAPEQWTTGEAHAYKFRFTLQDNTLAQTKIATQTFTWEARQESPYSDVVMGDKPIGYWRLGERSGTTAVDQIAARNGTYVGTPTLAAASGFDHADTAVTFDGTTQYVEVATGGPFDFDGNKPFTIEAWVKPTALRRIAANDVGGNGGGWSFYGSGGNSKAAFTRQDAGGLSDLAFTSANLDITGTTWQHVVATYDGASIRVYLNGVGGTSVASSRTMPVQGDRMRIGTYSGGAPSNSFQGAIDEVAIYDRALVASEITAHYAARTG